MNTKDRELLKVALGEASEAISQINVAWSRDLALFDRWVAGEVGFDAVADQNGGGLALAFDAAVAALYKAGKIK